MWQERLAQLVTTCHWIGAKGWAPATGGNMSVRQDDTRCWLSESGRDKGSLTTEDFLQVEIATNRAPSGRKPSAETGLHTPVYRLFPEANVVLHVHTVNATVLSRIESDTLALQGYEMQKTLSGQHSHLDTVPIAIFDNDQILTPGGADCRLCANPPAALRLSAARPRPDLLGKDIQEARRQLEGLEFLFECELMRRRYEP